MTDIIEVPAVEGAIRNPSNPHHFMVVQPVGGRVRIWIDNTEVARSSSALRVIEVGRKAYEPRMYIPSSDVLVPLARSEKTTHCPLKGEASYLCLDGREVGWTYAAFDFAKVLDDHVSFWGAGRRIEETTVD
ncbi:MAG: DUF427 domain-containing protein [Pseudomonadota bacterium]